MVFHLNLPLKDPTMTFQIYDKDILSADDFISEATLNFHNLAKEAFENDSSVKLYQEQSLLSKTRKTVDDALNLDFKKPEEKKESEIKDGEKKVEDQKKKDKGMTSGEKVEIMLQNAKKEGYVSTLKYL